MHFLSRCPDGLYGGMFGQIHHPGYPKTYGQNLYCYYQIVVPEGHIIEMSMTMHSEAVGNCTDNLSLFDGAGVADKMLDLYAFFEKAMFINLRI